MKSHKISWRRGRGWSQEADDEARADQALIVVFGSRAVLEQPEVFETLIRRFPKAVITGCSTGGQIEDDHVDEHGAHALVMRFDKTRLASASAHIVRTNESLDVGRRLGEALRDPELKGALVLSDGLHVNGAQLVKGVREGLGSQVAIVGGLAGDGENFQHTLVHGCGVTKERWIAAVGFYGPSIRIGASSSAGWSPFGPQRTITRSEGSALYELDGHTALDLYKYYLGEEAAGLPGTGLLYPLSIHDPADPSTTIIRSLLAVDELNASMTFAGDVPQGWRAQLMRGYFGSLSQASYDATKAALANLGDAPGQKAVMLISCIGRKIVMGESVVEEIAAARSALDDTFVTAGFYSYGEISPHPSNGCSELHNQTMTVTAFAET